jgi:predicted neuraminidase
MREAGSSPVSLSLPGGTFIRSPLFVRSDDAWLLPLFRCIPKPGYRWNGSHDTAAIALSTDAGRHWREIDIPQSEGCVHTTLIAVDTNTIAAFFRRRQADFIFRCESRDGGDTWSTPVATDIPNNNSSIAAITLQDGRVAIACNPVNRDSSELRRESLYDEVDEDDERVSATGGCNPVWGVPRAPLSLCFSSDGGLSFEHRIVIEQSSGNCLSNNSEDGRNFELSYPSLLQREDGSLDLAYTYFRRAIKHTRLSSDWLEKS